MQYNQAQSNLPEVIREASLKDPEYAFLWKQASEAQAKGEQSNYGITLDKMLTFRNRIYIPN